jgi:hypothetical protein
MNVRQQNDRINPELSKVMKNVREWKFVEGEKTRNILGLLKTSNETIEIIYICIVPN